MMKKLWLCFFLISTFSFADSSILQTWGVNSFKQLKEDYQKQPFLLVLWSLECPSCYKELAVLGRWKRQHPKSNLVIVSTDSSNMLDDAIHVLKEYELDKTDGWIFSSENSAKLRNSIDANWFGELPRSYFFNAQHQVFSHSGTLTDSQLNKWQTLISGDK